MTSFTNSAIIAHFLFVVVLKSLFKYSSISLFWSVDK